MRVLFLDIETGGLNPETSIVWQVVYAKTIQQENTLHVLEITELVGKECILSREVYEALRWSDVLVGHNVLFEEGFLKARGLTPPEKTYCTMRKATPICAIPHDFYGYKYPKLSEVVSFFDLEDQLKTLVEGSYHDALYDIWATILVYTTLENLNLSTEDLKVRKANTLLKYITAKKYAYEGYKEKILERLRQADWRLRFLSWLVQSEWKRKIKAMFRRKDYEDEDIPF